MNWKVLFFLPLLFMGCVQDVIEPENIQLERGITKSSSERIISLTTWTRTGTSYRTMQVHVTKPLSGNLIINFEAHPVTPKSIVLNAHVSNPCFLAAGQTFAEVDLPEVAADWVDIVYNKDTGSLEDKVKTTTTYTFEIMSIEYSGDNDPLYIDQSKWKVSRAFEAEIYGWDIVKVFSDGIKNYRYPYDVIGGTEPNPNPGTGGGGGGGGGPKDPPSRPQL